MAEQSNDGTDGAKAEAGAGKSELGESDAQKERRLPSWVMFLGIMLIGAIPICIDPFELGEDFRDTGQDLLMRTVFAPRYGQSSDYTHQTTVALLRESSLRSISKAYGETLALYGSSTAEQGEPAEGDEPTGGSEAAEVDQLTEGGEPAEGKDEGEQDVQSKTDSSEEEEQPQATLSWPLPLSFHAMVLEEISFKNPKAIFVDILFLDRRQNDGAQILKSLLLRSPNFEIDDEGNWQAGTTAGVPIYFAEDINQHPPMRDDLLDARCYDSEAGEWQSDPQGPASLQTECRAFARNLFPVPKTPEEGILRQYPVARDGKLTAAFALLQEPELELDSDWTRAEKDALDETAANLELIWGSSPHDINRDWMGTLEESEEDVDKAVADGAPANNAGEPNAKKKKERIPCPSIDYHPLDWLWKALFTARTAFMQTCPYVGTVPVETLLFGNQDRQVDELIDGKVVFYGVDLRGASDVIYPPIHTSLPGVYIHAMALDNLLTMGPDYLHRVQPDTWRYAIEFSALAILAVIFIVFWRLDKHIEVNYKEHDLCQVVLRLHAVLLYCLVSILFFVLFGLLLTYGFDIAPHDWVGAAGLWVGMAVIRVRHIVVLGGKSIALFKDCLGRCSDGVRFQYQKLRNGLHRAREFVLNRPFVGRSRES